MKRERSPKTLSRRKELVRLLWALRRIQRGDPPCEQMVPRLAAAIREARSVSRFVKITIGPHPGFIFAVAQEELRDVEWRDSLLEKETRTTWDEVLSR